ncbi:MAG: zinc-binding dehydrogenase, partial [Desulfatitalea sp.]|nr:zinc-binding dehydrogenase [Desulfatitalea sp.]NNJ99061.1 zinc-binding dehydrogenase [Desulfatitalea sp.]
GSGFIAGDHVAACGFIDYPGKAARILGAFAERIVAPVENVAKVSSVIPLERAALFRVHTETSYYALQRGRLVPGETLLVLGAGGATGFAAVQLGKLMGARVIASASTREKRNIALAGGANGTIDSNDPDWRARVKECTGGRGVDVVFDPVGGDFTERAFRSLAWKGRHLIIGFTAGKIPSIPVNLAMLKGSSVIGINLLEAQRREPTKFYANARALMDLFDMGKLTVPPIVRRFPLEEASEALAAAIGGKVAGRMVIDIAKA